DLPEPEGPMTETISPRGMASETWSSATTSRLPANCLVTDRSSIIVGADEEAGAGGASDRSAVAIRPDYVNGFTMVVKSGLILAVSRRHAAPSLHASGAAEPDRHLLAVDDHRHRTAS